MDTSLVYGKNKMDFTIENTLNRSLGPTSKTKFDAGGFDYDQLVLNFSGVRQVEVGALRLAAERRGRPRGAARKLLDLRRRAGLVPQRRRAAAERHADAVRRAGVPGLPAGERSGRGPHRRRRVRRSRSEPHGQAPRLGRGARRALFGLRRATSPASSRRATTSPSRFALRGSVQNGFRAPSLQQQFFATTSTNFINGVPFDITTFPVTDPVAVRSARSRSMRRSRSTSRSARCCASASSSITVDAYRINIDDRIVLSENLTQAERARLPQRSGLHRRRRRPLLHQRRGHAKPRASTWS